MGTKMKPFTFAVGALLCMSSHAATIGFMEVTNKGDIFLHTLQKVAPDEIIVIQTSKTDSVQTCCQVIRPGELEATEKSSSVMTEDDAEPVTYRVKTKLAHLSGHPELRVAVSGKVELTASYKDGLDFKESGAEYQARACYGVEGLNLTLRSMKNKSQSIYYYFGYDIEPTCPISPGSSGD